MKLTLQNYLVYKCPFYLRHIRHNIGYWLDGVNEG